MATITADEFQVIMNKTDSDISNTNAEYIIDLAIDLLNTYGADLPNMGGTAGSKTVSVESRQKGAVMLVARAVYYGFYKGVEAVGVGGLAVAVADVLGNATVVAAIKDAARQLVELDVSYG